MAPFSIFEELTRSQDRIASSSATTVIDFLVRSLAQEACNGVRGAQTYYRLVSRARDISDHINGLVDQLEENRDWDTFYSYNSQIWPLEECLFRMSKLVQEEVKAYQPLEPESIQECLDGIKCWQENRAICREVVQILHQEPFQVLQPYDWSDDITAAACHDDLAWISSIIEAITDALAPLVPQIMEDPKKMAHIMSAIQKIAEVQEILENRFDVEDHIMLLSTRYFMILHGIVTLGVHSKTSPTIRRHLNSPKTWEMANGLTEKLLDELQYRSKSFDNLLNEFYQYELYLLNPEIKDIDGLLRDIILYPCKVTMPYRARSIALVKGCKAIGEFLKTEDPADGMERFEELIELVTAAMEESIELGLAPRNFGKYSKQPIMSCISLDRAMDAMRDFQRQFMGLVGVVDQVMGRAHDKDKRDCDLLREHTNRLEDRGVAVDQDPKDDDVLDIQLHISNYGEDKTSPISYSMRSGGDLDSFLWNLSRSSNLTDPTPLGNRPRIYNKNPNNAVSKMIRPGQLTRHAEAHFVGHTKNRVFESPLRRLTPAKPGVRIDGNLDDESSDGLDFAID